MKRKTSSPSKPARSMVGVRLSEDERKLLMTVSQGRPLGEAIRVLIEQARKERAAPTSMEEAMGRIQGWVRWKGDAVERSRVLEDVVREAETVLAALMVHQGQSPITLESLVVDRGFDLVDRLMQAALVSEATAYDPQVVRQRLDRSRALMVAAIAAVAEQHSPRASGALS